MKDIRTTLRTLVLAGVTVGLALGAWAQDPVGYLAPVYKEIGGVRNVTNGIERWETRSTNVYTVVTNCAAAETWNAGWYVVTNEVALLAGAVCLGDVHLILADGAKLAVTGSTDKAGICVSGKNEDDNGNALTIYGQSGQTGKLIAEGGPRPDVNWGGGAGIGGNRGLEGKYITINGGDVTANGGGLAAGIGGGYAGIGRDIAINGGTVRATGGDDCAGIGGGNGARGYSITINGGSVMAMGTGSGAGIGGGQGGSGGSDGTELKPYGVVKLKCIIINGGDVTATGGCNQKGGYSGAGIGGGSGSEGRYIVIGGGTVRATGGDCGGAGIGGGLGSMGHDIAISGGTVIATGCGDGAGIGGGSGYFGCAYNIAVSGGTVTATGNGGGAGIGSGKDDTGMGYSSCHDITVSGGSVTATGGSDGVPGIGSGTGVADASGIYVSADLSVKADTVTPPVAEIVHDIGTDIALDLKGKRYAALTPPPMVTVTPQAVTGASTYKVFTNETVEVTGEGEPPTYTVYSNEVVKVVYTADKDFVFPDGKTTWTTNFTASAAAVTVTLPEGWDPVPRAPNYAEKTGNDWLFNSSISGKKYASEAAESSIDLFYIYPTLSGGEIVIDGFRGIDDATMRGDEVPSFETAAGAFHGNARCFADMTHVYAPYYRQATLKTAFDCATNELGQIKATANADYLKALYEGPAYADVTNALETYFFTWNRGRKFILAGHSQGSAILRLVMEKYFMQDGLHKGLLKNLVASYQIGYGVSKMEMDKITKATGVKFATTSNDVGVVVSYNIFGPGATGNSVLLPDDAIAINPISWTTNTTPADKSLNLGAISQTTGEAIGAGLYGATVNAERGTVECAEFPESAYVGKEVFGEKSLHGQDYPAYWENLRENNYVRGGKSAGYCKLCTTNFPAHLCVSNAYYTTKSDTATKNWVEPVGGTVWIPTNNLKVAIVYLVPEKGYRMFYDSSEAPFLIANIQSSLKGDGEFLIRGDVLSSITFKWIQRAPDYAEATGKDWLFHHDIAEKKYEGEPADDPGVDLFYLYPTSVNETDDHCVDGVCDIDNETMRSDGNEGALASWKMTAEVFGGYTRVYAPYYRQTPFDFELNYIYQETGVETANERLAEYWYDHAPYTDVTNALTHYFTVINPDQGGGARRPFIFAGHSHGAGMLRLVMERFFTNETQKAWLKNMVACYAVGYGLTKDVEKTIKEKAGVPFAANATDTGVYIMWNTQGAGVTPGGASALWPANPAAPVNPITWTRETGAYAAASKNLGGWTTNAVKTIEPGLYDASNLVENGTVTCSSPDLVCKYLPDVYGFGEKSLHTMDYRAYWENIRQNGLQRIQTWKADNDFPVHSQIPLVGQPIDYTSQFNWVTNSITATGVTRDVDALFFYPTQELEGDSTFMPVTDAHKAKAYGWYTNNATAFEGYANIIMPAYRQMNMASVTAGQTLYPTGSEFFDFLRRTVSRTDLFAALDYYFTEINKDGKRPFFLAGHSQGSAQIKVLLLDYFTREENKAKLTNLVAAYALGYSFGARWINDLGVNLKAATSATDTKVVVSWNTEGTNAVEHSFVVEDGAIAINPMNWTTIPNVWSETTPDAMIQKRAGYADGTYVLVTTNSTDFVPTSMGMGERSLHKKDWSLWHDQIRANGWTRYMSVSGLKKVETNGIPAVVGASWKIVVKDGVGEWKEPARSPIDGCYYVSGSAQADSVRLIYTLDDPSGGKRFVNGETETYFPMVIDKGKGVWTTTATAAEIAAATKTGNTPMVQLGIVAQRYPWNGFLDIRYRTPFANATYYVTFFANGVQIGTDEGTGGEARTTAIDLNTAAAGAFKDKALKDVKITATIE